MILFIDICQKLLIENLHLICVLANFFSFITGDFRLLLPEQVTNFEDNRLHQNSHTFTFTTVKYKQIKLPYFRKEKHHKVVE